MRFRTAILGAGCAASVAAGAVTLIGAGQTAFVTGRQSVASGDELRLASSASLFVLDGGTLRVESNGVLGAETAGGLAGVVFLSGTVENFGTIADSVPIAGEAGSSILMGDGSRYEAGQIALDGSLSFEGTSVFFPDVLASAGSMIGVGAGASVSIGDGAQTAAGVMELRPGASVVNGGTVTVGGAYAVSLMSDAGGEATWTNGAGSMLVLSDGSFEVESGGFVNDGEIVNDGGRLTIGRDASGAPFVLSGSGSYRQIGGRLTVDGEITLPVIEFSQGLLEGRGVVRDSDSAFSFPSTVTIDPGTALPLGETLTLDGEISAFDGNLVIDLYNTTSGLSNDTLAVNGAVVFGEASSMIARFDYVPAIAETFVVLRAQGGTTGNFESLSAIGPSGSIISARVFVEPDAVGERVMLEVTSVGATACDSAADVDRNGRVDVFDLLLFLRNFRQTPVCDFLALCAVADIDRDDDIDVFDLIAFLGSFSDPGVDCSS